MSSDSVSQPISGLQSPASPGNRIGALLQSYFRSGWAFFIPYLAAYLLYAWFKWPVNPATGDSPPPTVLSPPNLLQLYWALHAIHLFLGIIALRAWWKDYTLNLQLSCSAGALDASASGLRSPVSAAAYRLLPWACLALIFWIPGLYLEWPSDPWDHLRRINEWHSLDQVPAHSAWKKSSYFLPYSLTGHTTGLPQLSWLNVYYTTACLLLSWQYFQLARAIGLSERASFVYVLLNAVTFGNNIFSFYRYYGISSSILAQIGAVALTRIALEAFSVRSPKRGHGQIFDSPRTTRNSLLRTAGAGLALLLLIAFNHIQAIGISGLGLLAIFVWRLIAWNRTMILWLVGAAVLLSLATVLWFPRHPAIDEEFRMQAWLNVWYGFNFYSPTSPTYERSLHILGTFGGLNLCIGVWLVACRNHIAGWLTLMPVLALSLPCIAVPFAHVVAHTTSPGNIVTFHRMLLAAPMGLALVAAIAPRTIDAAAKGRATSPTRLQTGNRQPTINNPWYLAPVLSILLVLILTTGKSSYNRFWHSIMISPADLQLVHHLSDWKPALPTPTNESVALPIYTPLGHEIQHVFFQSYTASWERLRLANPSPYSDSLNARLRDLQALMSIFTPAASNSKAASSDRLALPRREASIQQITSAPTSTDSPWIALSGVSPEHTFAHGKLTISNSIGNDSVTFNQNLIPISRYKRYQLSSKVRQVGNKAATNFLAVAWYDLNGQLLPSRLEQPEGAGAPWGWNNSTYSYYGLIDEPASITWTQYSVTFGLGEAASIPSNANYIRIGALLNYRATPGTIVEITDVTLVEYPAQSHLILTAPGYWHLFTPASQAALLSRHWAIQHVPNAHAGTEELRSTVIGSRPD